MDVVEIDPLDAEPLERSGEASALLGAAGPAPGLRDLASAHLDVAKQDLGIARLGHFLALVYLLAVLASVAPGFTH
jgi:hypothetical protein